jgi:hypothetical protein
VQLLYAQEEPNRQNIPFVKLGYGYFNADQMIDGNILSGEIGLKLKNSYLVSLKMNFADALNDIANYPDFKDVTWNFVYSYKWLSLNLGYEFMTKNHRHSIIPMLGPFYSTELKTTPTSDDNGMFMLDKYENQMVGVDISLQYLYNFRNGISIGMNASGSLAYQYGPTYISVLPIILMRLK